LPSYLSAPPRFIEPQHTKIAEKAPGGDAWAHEIKYDGYRIAARIVGDKAQPANAAAAPIGRNDTRRSPQRWASCRRSRRISTASFAP
jgi:hypothetical protein